jgi:hypothetical protein
MINWPKLNSLILLRNIFLYRVFSYLNTAAVASYSIPHCTRVAIRLTLGRAAIPAIPFCHVPNMALFLLIQNFGQRSIAMHYPQFEQDS